MAGDRRLEEWELDDDEAVEFLGAFEVVDLRARDPISDISSSMPTVSMLGIVAARFAIVSCEQFGPYRTVFD